VHLSGFGELKSDVVVFCKIEIAAVLQSGAATLDAGEVSKAVTCYHCRMILGNRNSWRLDSSHRRGHRRDIPCLVDASDVRAVNALNP
jgi:hypothetical protein